MREQTSHFKEPALQTIPGDEVVYHPHSFADPDGRVFLWGDQLYRGIYPAAEPFFRKLAEEGIFSNLAERGLLIHSELTFFTSAEFPLIFRHDLVQFASYPQEWSPPMFKDAALAILNIAIELAHAGLLLKDGHPWNVMFNSCQPVYIDIGSIAPANGHSIWPAYPDFCRYCLYPLILMSQGYDLIGRLLMCEDRGVRESELFRLAPSLALKAYSRWPMHLVTSHAAKHLASALSPLPKKELSALTSSSRQQTRIQKKLLSFLERLRQFVESIPVSTFENKKVIQKKSAKSTPESCDNQAMNAEIIDRLVTELTPESMLDINSGNGLAAMQAASRGVRVVCFDADCGKASLLYTEAKTKGLSILPLFMDFTKPTAARGVGNHWAIAATERFQCDLVLALGFMNQPMPQRLGLDKVISGLSRFSKRWFVLEIPLDPDSARIQMKDRLFQDFSMDIHIQTLKKYFSTVTKIDSPLKASAIFVCEKSS